MTRQDTGSEELTRKQRREQAREERKALQESERARAERRRRMGQLGGVIGAVVIIIVVIAVASSGGGTKANTNTSGGSAAHTEEVSAVTSLLNGIPQSGNVLGNPKAPVTMIYYGDLECPICKEFTLTTLPTLIQRFVKPGKMKIEYRALETATREPETFRTQQVAALAAGKQKRMWDYVELFYHEQGAESTGYVTESYLQGLAQQVPGLNFSKWTADRADPALASSVASDAQAANQLGFNGTPSFQLGKSGGTLAAFTPTSFTEVSAFTPSIEKLGA
jgi:protein-disulfide isomerase